MPQVSDVIFCLKALNVDNQGVSANNILTAITPEYIPGLFTFSVIVTVVDIDSIVGHQLLIQFLSPTEEEVICIESPLPIMRDETNLPNEYKGINIVMDWNNVNFKASGLYTIRVCIDGDFIGEKKIYVKGKNE